MSTTTLISKKSDFIEVNQVPAVEVDKAVSKKYRKELLKAGEYLDRWEYMWTGEKVFIKYGDKEFNEAIDNFNNRVLGSPVMVVLNHSQAIEKTTGEVDELYILDREPLGCLRH